MVALAFVAGVICLPALRSLTGAASQTADGGAAAVQGEGGEAGGTRLDVGTIDWEKAPRVDLVCRTYGGSLHIMWNTFMPSYLVSAVWCGRAYPTAVVGGFLFGTGGG